MDNLILILTIALIGIICFVIFRVISLLTILRNPGKREIGTSNRINASLFIILPLICFIWGIWYAMKAEKNYLPVASEHGIVTDNLFWITIAIIGFAFIVTHIFLFYFSYKYQYKADRKAHFFADNNRLEIIWTVIPAIVLAVLVFAGWKTWRDITKEAPKDSEVIEIIGKQFAWQVRYPGKDTKLGVHNFRYIDATNEMGVDFTDKASLDDFIPREIHIPKGKPVLFKIRARDVLHSVYAPHFRLKMDAVPGMPTRFWFVPNKTTLEMRSETGNNNFNYELACAEICGKGHFGMRFLIIVDEPEDYEKWYTSQKSWAESNKAYVEDFVKRVKTNNLATK